MEKGFVSRMVKAAVFIILAVGNFFCAYVLSWDIAVGKVPEKDIALGLVWLILVAVAVLFMFALHEIFEGVGEKDGRKR